MLFTHRLLVGSEVGMANGERALKGHAPTPSFLNRKKATAPKKHFQWIMFLLWKCNLEVSKKIEKSLSDFQCCMLFFLSYALFHCICKSHYDFPRHCRQHTGEDIYFAETQCLSGCTIVVTFLTKCFLSHALSKYPSNKCASVYGRSVQYSTHKWSHEVSQHLRLKGPRSVYFLCFPMCD